MIKQLKSKGLSITQIAKEVGVDRVPFRFLGNRVGGRDLKNGMIEIYETGVLIDTYQNSVVNIKCKNEKAL